MLLSDLQLLCSDCLSKLWSLAAPVLCGALGCNHVSSVEKPFSISVSLVYDEPRRFCSGLRLLLILSISILLDRLVHILLSYQERD